MSQTLPSETAQHEKHEIVKAEDEEHSPSSASSKRSVDVLPTATTAVEAPPPPTSQDGGTRAWLQVLGSFLVFGNLWGMPFAFGRSFPTSIISTISNFKQEVSNHITNRTGSHPTAPRKSPGSVPLGPSSWFSEEFYQGLYSTKGISSQCFSSAPQWRLSQSFS
jgi:hypothetical protein